MMTKAREPLLQRELETAKDLAKAAGEVILRHYERGVAVELKGPGDPVTMADRDANRLITEGLARAFPNDAILAEESPLDDTRHAHARLWCVDPLDGTREFIAHNGEFVVMIGLAIDGEARLGVVYQPTTDELYFGAGGEAYREHDGEVTPLRTSTLACPDGEAVLMVSRSHLSRQVEAAARRLRVAKCEPRGSVGLKVARIAAGHADIYLSFSNRTFEWDACAPEAILRAAGGEMTDVDGLALRYNKPEPNTPRGLLASNGPLHARCVAVIKESCRAP